MDQTTIDNITAQRFIHYLVTPIEQWEACRIGIIDKQGKMLRQPKNSSETMYFNMFHQLTLRVKELMKASGKGTNWVLPSNAGKFYLGNKNLPASNFTNWNIANKSSLPIFGAAYSSMKECVNLGDMGLFEAFFNVYLTKQNQSDINEMQRIIEDGTFGSSIPSSGGDVIVTKPSATAYKKKNELKTALLKKVLGINDVGNT